MISNKIELAAVPVLDILNANEGSKSIDESLDQIRLRSGTWSSETARKDSKDATKKVLTKREKQVRRSSDEAAYRRQKRGK